MAAAALCMSGCRKRALNLPVYQVSRGEMLARRAKFLLESAAMLATMKHVVLVLLIAALPAQALAAIIQPICHEDRVASAAPAHHQAHAESEHHHHDAPSLDHGHPLTMGDLSLDHCSSGCAFALPATMTKLPIMPGPEHDSLTAARFTGHVPEQPQRPPRS